MRRRSKMLKILLGKCLTEDTNYKHLIASACAGLRSCADENWGFSKWRIPGLELKWERGGIVLLALPGFLRIFTQHKRGPGPSPRPATAST